jgi:hypothetical protein
MVGKFLAGLAGLSLATTPALAQSQAQGLSLQQAPVAQRAEAPTDDESNLAGGWLPIILVVAIVAGGILLAAGVFDDDHGRPSSP